MTARRLTTDQLRNAAAVATEQGVTITIEAAGRVYRITPGAQTVPLTTSEKDIDACDRAFGLS